MERFLISRGMEGCGERDRKVNVGSVGSAVILLNGSAGSRGRTASSCSYFLWSLVAQLPLSRRNYDKLDEGAFSMVARFADDTKI
eukprot:g25839.t1